MLISASDVVSLTQSGACQSSSADQTEDDAEKLSIAIAQSCEVSIDADRLDHYPRFERERVHLLLINDALRGLDDIGAYRTCDADAAVAAIQTRRMVGAIVIEPSGPSCLASELPERR